MQKTKKIISILIVILVVIAIAIIGIYMSIVNKGQHNLKTTDINDTQDETNFDTQEENINKFIYILLDSSKHICYTPSVPHYIDWSWQLWRLVNVFVSSAT